MERAGRASDWNGGSLGWRRHLLVTEECYILQVDAVGRMVADAQAFEESPGSIGHAAR